MALGAPQGWQALWLQLMTIGVGAYRGVGVEDLYKILLGFLASISALFS